MKKLFLMIPVLMVGYFLFTGQSSESDPRRWSPDPRMTRLYATGEYVQLPRDNSYTPNT